MYDVNRSDQDVIDVITSGRSARSVPEEQECVWLVRTV